MTDLNITDVTALRATLWANGFRPVPVYNHDHTGPSPGKRPLGQGWRDDALHDPPLCATSPAVPHALNSGILTDGLRAIDVDVDDKDVSEEIDTAVSVSFGWLPRRWRDNSPRALYLARAAEGAPRKRVVSGPKGKVEILGAGQQFVAYGTHPSGAELNWTGPMHPRRIKVDDLKAVTEDQITEFLIRCAAILGAEPPEGAGDTPQGRPLGRPLGKPGKALQANGHAGNGYAPNGHAHAPTRARGASGNELHISGVDPYADPIRLAEALSDIPNDGPPEWEAWNRVGMAIWRATGGSDDGWAVWDAWSRRNPAYSHAETLERWRHYPDSPPEGIGAGTIFYLAHEAREAAGGRTLRHAREVREVRGEVRELAKEREPIEITPQTLRSRDLDNIPPRQWVYGRELIKPFVSVLGSTGGVGKTTYSISVMLSVATGMSLLTSDRYTPTARTKVHKQGRVWIYNLEDPMEELDRRIAAAIRHHGIPFESVADQIFVNSGRDNPLIIAERRENGALIIAPIVEPLIAALIEQEIVLMIIDPFAQSHSAEENRNDEMNLVMALWNRVAAEANCAVWLVHHFRKGAAAAGDAESFRGAGAIQGAARAMHTISPMSVEEAEKMGIPVADRRQYIRHDEAKSNMAASIGTAAWLRLVSVPLDNETAEYPDGDWVQVAEEFVPLSPWAGLEWPRIAEIMELIEKGPSPDEYYAAAKQAGDRWVGHVIARVTGLTAGQAGSIVTQWKKTGLLETGFYLSPGAKRQAGCIRVNAAKLSEMRQEFEGHS
jgi:hypothetical protein